MDGIEKEILSEERKIRAIKKKIKALRNTMHSKAAHVEELKLLLDKKLNNNGRNQ